MKRIAILLLAVLMLTGILTACSGSAYVEGNADRGYSNVSTTDDGTVNGTNGAYRRSTTRTNDSYGNTGTTGYQSTTRTGNGSSNTRTTRTTGSTGSTANTSRSNSAVYRNPGSGASVSGNGMSAGTVNGQ